jgi:hypothetical protein
LKNNAHHMRFIAESSERLSKMTENISPTLADVEIAPRYDRLYERAT